MDEAELSQNG